MQPRAVPHKTESPWCCIFETALAQRVRSLYALYDGKGDLKVRERTVTFAWSQAEEWQSKAENQRGLHIMGLSQRQ